MAAIDILHELEKIRMLLVDQSIFHKDVLNFKEAAQFLSISNSYLYKLTSSGQIPHYKPEGKLIYFQRAELQNWLLRNRVKSADDIESTASTTVALSSK